MGTNYTPTLPITGIANLSELRDELDRIRLALEASLSREGDSPNQMEADFDMNSKRILNLLDAIQDSEPVTLRQLNAAAFPEGQTGGPNYATAALLHLSDYPEPAEPPAGLSPIFQAVADFNPTESKHIIMSLPISTPAVSGPPIPEPQVWEYIYYDATTMANMAAPDTTSPLEAIESSVVPGTYWVRKELPVSEDQIDGLVCNAISSMFEFNSGAATLNINPSASSACGGGAV